VSELADILRAELHGHDTVFNVNKWRIDVLAEMSCGAMYKIGDVSLDVFLHSLQEARQCVNYIKYNRFFIEQGDE